MKVYNVMVAVAACGVLWSSISMAAKQGLGWKIAIIDGGIMRNHPHVASNIDDPLCWSEPDQKTGDSTNARTGYVHYKVASTCPGGAKSSLTANDDA